MGKGEKERRNWRNKHLTNRSEGGKREGKLDKEGREGEKKKRVNIETKKVKKKTWKIRSIEKVTKKILKTNKTERNQTSRLKEDSRKENEGRNSLEEQRGEGIPWRRRAVKDGWRGVEGKQGGKAEGEDNDKKARRKKGRKEREWSSAKIMTKMYKKGEDD